MMDKLMGVYTHRSITWICTEDKVTIYSNAHPQHEDSKTLMNSDINKLHENILFSVQERGGVLMCVHEYICVCV